LKAGLLYTPYLGGALPCAKDIAVFPFIRQFAAVEPDWFAQQAVPATQAWVAQWLGSLLFEACMFKIPRQKITPYPFFDGQSCGRKV